MKTVKLIDRNGKIRKGKKVIITTTFDCNINEMWQRIQNVSTLMSICRPMAKFTPHKGEVPTSWTVGKSYDFNLYIHSIPIGKHTIKIERMDEHSHEIESREYNILVPVWNHLIKMQPANNNQVQYTDEIDIYAGILTSFVAWWSCRFYQHRQQKWKTILRK